MNNKLQAKDLINIGIFTAIYFVVFFATGTLGYIPILLVLVPLICPIAAGIPMMLYVTKVNKFGMITITGVICGLLMFLTGHNVYPIITAPVCGFLYDVILLVTKYKSSKAVIFGYGIFSMWLMGMMAALFFATDSYTQMMVTNYGEEYVSVLRSITPSWTFPMYTAFAFIGGIIGALLGKSVLKKHFIKAGIA